MAGTVNEPQGTPNRMSQRYEKLKTLLRELFQLDQPDLDFGLYRVMHAKSAEVSQFLEKDLLPQVQAAFGQYRPADKAELERELSKVITGIETAGMNPDDSPRVKDLRAHIKSDAIDIGALESEVYDHLFSFFRRYYSEGDFLAKRVYKPGVYSIPYEGEEVMLHWANKDQYYIKTSEYLRDYAFRLMPEDEKKPMRAHFRLADVSEGEHGNVKAAEGNNRVFVLVAPGESGHDFMAEEDGERGKELIVLFEYRPATLTDWSEEERLGKKKPPVQKDLIALATKRILAAAGAALPEWLGELGAPHVMASGETADYCRLEAHLKRYTARNTFDYFIHKDLGAFLRRELDFYIKNEVMHLDDVENESAPRVEQYVSKIKVIRRIAGKIIEFLSQLEDFQKKLWLKKKFVVDTQYCFTLDCISEDFYPEIAANEAQRHEWVTLFSIDKVEENLTQCGYGKPLSPRFLKEHPTLVIDTRHFNNRFTARLLDTIGELDTSIQGVLLHSHNFHALSLLKARYRNGVRAVYADPPYNTGTDEFAYKDNYQHSSWISMMSELNLTTRDLLADNGNYFCSIDDNEIMRLRLLLDRVFSPEAFVAEIAYERSGSSGLGQGGSIVNTKESILAYSLCKTDLNQIVHARPIEYETLKRYNKVLMETGTREKVHGFIAPATREEVEIFEHRDYCIESISLKNFESRKVEILEEYRRNFYKIFRLTSVQKENDFQNRILSQCKDGLYSADYLVSRGKQSGKWITAYYYSGQTFVWIRDSARLDRTTIVKENKITDHWSHGEIPKADLANEGGVTLSRGKKPEQLLKRFIDWGSDEGEVVLDYFSGSATTAAVACKSGRRYVAVDNEQYFDEKTLLRLKNTLYGDTSGISKMVGWSGGGCFKYLRLESYEDTLNNLETCRTNMQQDLLNSAEAQGADGFKEQYLLCYMLDVETRGSQSLLNVQAFSDPTAYKLKVKRPGSDESREVNVDLLETFNWLIGLTVRHIAAPQTFDAAFERDDEKRLRLKGRLRQEEDGPYWFRTVTGTTPDSRRTLVIWRKLIGESEQDNLVLDEWFSRQGYSARDSEVDLIYVNGGNNLENLKTPDDLWKVRLIEEDFHRLMFDVEGT